jgi:hypothetical protein
MVKSFLKGGMLITYRSKVQFAHLAALIAIVERQWGPSLVVGSAGAFSFLLMVFMPLIRRNTEKATIKKLMADLNVAAISRRCARQTPS